MKEHRTTTCGQRGRVLHTEHLSEACEVDASAIAWEADRVLPRPQRNQPEETGGPSPSPESPMEAASLRTTDLVRFLSRGPRPMGRVAKKTSRYRGTRGRGKSSSRRSFFNSHANKSGRDTHVRGVGVKETSYYPYLSNLLNIAKTGD
jgi:hypothetical protein